MQGLSERDRVIVGDVHGHITLLRHLWRSLQTDVSDLCQRDVIFIGDLIDRGPDSRAVLDFVLNVKRGHCVMGNHELALAGALGLIDAPSENHWPKRYVSSYDAAGTFRSYGVEPGDLNGLARAMPQEHKDFLAALPWAIRGHDYVVVHAGLLPNMSFGEQEKALDLRDFTLNRPPWLSDRALNDAPLPQDCDVTVISGHVPVSQVTFRDRRILLDVDGGTGQKLAAVLMPERRAVTVNKGGKALWTSAHE